MNILVVEAPHRCMVIALGYIPGSAIVGLHISCRAPLGWVGLVPGLRPWCPHLEENSPHSLEHWNLGEQPGTQTSGHSVTHKFIPSVSHIDYVIYFIKFTFFKKKTFRFIGWPPTVLFTGSLNGKFYFLSRVKSVHLLLLKGLLSVSSDCLVFTNLKSSPLGETKAVTFRPSLSLMCTYTESL